MNKTFGTRVGLGIRADFRRAFTLLELILALIMLGIFAVMAMRVWHRNAENLQKVVFTTATGDLTFQRNAFVRMTQKADPQNEGDRPTEDPPRKPDYRLYIVDEISDEIINQNGQETKEKVVVLKNADLSEIIHLTEATANSEIAGKFVTEVILIGHSEHENLKAEFEAMIKNDQPPSPYR